MCKFFLMFTTLMCTSLSFAQINLVLWVLGPMSIAESGAGGRAFFNIYTGGAKAPPAPMLAPH